MENLTAKPVIDNLKKITLSVTVGASPQTSDIIDHPESFKFIFGLGVDGLTPFEYALSGKSIGDEVRLQMKTEELNRIFRHITPPFVNKLVNRGELFLTAKITAVETADGREVIRAMAEMAECGSACDCGCGCGGSEDTANGPDRF